MGVLVLGIITTKHSKFRITKRDLKKNLVTFVKNVKKSINTYLTKNQQLINIDIEITRKSQDMKLQIYIIEYLEIIQKLFYLF